ncbi:MAG TPA: 3-hydroxyacyl-CoA dehydrogenase [Roseiarcus sp.]
MAKVAVIGSGFVGRAWAISFARAGCEVALWDQDKDAPARALAYIGRLLPELEANDLLNGSSASEVVARIRVATTLESALEGTVHVQENTPEDVAVKRAVFARLDAAAPSDTVLASSTSAILPSAFTEKLKGRARCLVVHPINPPYLIPAAEVVPAPWTEPSIIERTATFLRSAGHAPIVMKRELDGFVMNRLQGALLEEAFRLVEQGYAGVEDVDIGIREGLALRWSFMGPFETIELNAPGGVRDYAERYQGIYSNMFPSMQWRVDWAGPVMEKVEAERRERLAADKLGDRQAWRDRRLIALAAHKRWADKTIGD